MANHIQSDITFKIINVDMFKYQHLLKSSSMRIKLICEIHYKSYTPAQKENIYGI